MAKKKKKIAKQWEYEVRVRGKGTYGANAPDDVAKIIKDWRAADDSLGGQDFLVTNRGGDLVPLVLNPHGEYILKPVVTKPFSELKEKAEAVRSALTVKTRPVDDEYDKAMESMLNGNPVPLELYYQKKNQADYKQKAAESFGLPLSSLAGPEELDTVEKVAASWAKPDEDAVVTTLPDFDGEDMPDAEHLEQALQDVAIAKEFFEANEHDAMPMVTIPAHYFESLVGKAAEAERMARDLKQATEEYTRTVNDMVEQDELIAHAVATAQREWEREHNLAFIGFGLIPTKVLADSVTDIDQLETVKGGEPRIEVRLTFDGVTPGSTLYHALLAIKEKKKAMLPPEPYLPGWNQ